MKANNWASRPILTIALFTMLLVIGTHPLNAQCGDNGFIDLTGTSPTGVSDLTDPEIKFQQRAMAVTNFNTCQTLLVPNGCGQTDYGQNFPPKVFARLASGNSTLQNEAIAALANLQRTGFGAMGTDNSSCPTSTGGQLLESVESALVPNATRRGDGDVTMIGLTAILYAYGKRGTNLLPQDVYTHVLSLIDVSPSIGSVETLNFGADPLIVCPVACAGSVLFAPCVAACTITLETLQVSVPETENHLNMIYASQYLANQLLLDETGDTKFDDSRNGYRPLMLNRLNDFVRNDFIEYNAHDYQDYTMVALLSLASWADDPVVKAAAKNVLNYISAKVAVSSNDARRSDPFRRHNDPGNFLCDELLLQHCVDPQTSFYMMLAGVTDILAKNSTQSWTVNNVDPRNLVNNLLPPNNTAPPNYNYGFQWAATTPYRVDPLILDLFVNPNDRHFYQFFHYSRTLETDGFQDSNDELYAGSPSYLISAGGHPTHNAYTADVPFPISVITGSHPGKDDDLGVAVATTLMPTRALHSRAERTMDNSAMIRFSNPGGQNMCAAPNFACGSLVSPAIPASYTVSSVVTAPPATGSWSFIDQHGLTGQFGYYVAFYQQDGFGFFEAYDTFSNPLSVTDLADFQQRVLNNNAGQTFSQGSVNTYKTIDGSVIQFMVDAEIVSINGKPPYNPTRTNGTIINNNGQGLVTITNPALGQSLTLDATIPPDHPIISVPGPLTLPDTCLGATSSATLNVCNVNTGTDNLLVYNILSQDTQFQATQPSSGFPVVVSPNFCYPFQVSFKPTGTGQKKATLTIDSSDPNTPFLKLPVTGNSPPPIINTTIANNGSFGNVCSGTQADLNLQIINQGQCNLNITSITSTSLPSFDNFVLPAGVTYPLVLSPDASVNVPIRFQPPAYGTANYVTCSNTAPQMASVTVASNDPTTPSLVQAVSGIEGCPNLVLSPQNLSGSFAYPPTVSDPTGTLGCYTDRQISVSNSGICPLTMASLSTANGSDGKGVALPATPLEFTVINPTAPVTISPGGAPVPVTVRFKPQILTDQNGYAPDQQTGTLSIVSNDPNSADNTGGLCGEPVYHSGARALVLDTFNNPVTSVAKVTLASKGLIPPFTETLMPAPLQSGNACGNTILYHLDNETLRPAGTTGNNPRASYVLSARKGSTSANMGFTLGQCQMQQIILQLK